MANEGSDEPATYGRRYWRRLHTAVRWLVDVFRGHAWSRHLDNHEE